MAAGRPTKYNPEYCEPAESFIGEGHSTESLGSKFDVHRDTIYEWRKVYPEFSDAIKRGEARRAALIESLLVRSAYEGKGSASAAIFLAKNWAGMSDRPVLDASINTEIEQNREKLRLIIEEFSS